MGHPLFVVMLVLFLIVACIAVLVFASALWVEAERDRIRQEALQHFYRDGFWPREDRDA